jgi:2-dehydropantoate 2-reductase
VIGVVGTGAIGRFVAAELAAGGADVVVLGRRAGAPPVEACRIDGSPILVQREPRLTVDPNDLADAASVIVAVKSQDTPKVAEQLRGVLSPETAVASLQNGLDAARALQRVLGERAAAGVVTYNVFLDPSGVARQKTSGKLIFDPLTGEPGRRIKELEQTLVAGGDVVELRPDIRAIQAGKLLLNLNNGVCAATGLGIAASLRDADARSCFSRCILEGLEAFRATGVRPARVNALPPGVIARALLLPNFIVTALARRIASVDEGARSSTLQDLDRGKATEIDDLNGAIVRIATQAGRRAPVNERVTEVIKRHEAAVLAGEKPKFVAARDLLLSAR